MRRDVRPNRVDVAPGELLVLYRWLREAVLLVAGVVGVNVLE